MIKTRMKNFFAVALAAGLLAVSGMSRAQNSIDSVNVTQQSGQILVRLTMKEPLAAVPASFTVANPARIAFDFPKTANNLGKNSQDIGEGDLRSMNLVQVGDRTRLVLNLRNMLQYQAKVDGKSLLVSLNAAVAAAPGASRFAEGAADGAYRAIPREPGHRHPVRKQAPCARD